MLKLLEKISSYGLTPDADPHTRESIRLLNRLSFLITLIFASFALIFFSSGQYYPALMTLVLVLGFSLILFVNGQGLYFFSKIAFLIFYHVEIFLVNTARSEEVHQGRMGLLLLLILPFVLFSEKEKKIRNLTLCFPILLFIVLEGVDYTFFPVVPLQTGLENTVVYVTWAVNALFFILVIRAAQKPSNLLTASNIERGKRMEDLQVVVENKEKKLREFVEELDHLVVQTDEKQRFYQEREKILQENVIKAEKEKEQYRTQEEHLRDTIKKLKRIQEEMQLNYQEQQKFVAMVENSFDFIALADFKGTVLYMNEAGHKMLGIGPEVNVRDFKVADLMESHTASFLYKKVLPEVVKSGFWKGELGLRNFKTKAVIDTDVTTFIIKDRETQQPLGWATIQRDITQRKQAERKLQEANNELYKSLENERKSREELDQTYNKLKEAQSHLVLSEKMASLGQLTAGIAHEINNPINFVYAGTDALNENLEELIQILNQYAKLDEAADLHAELETVKKLKQMLEYDVLIEDILSLTQDIRQGAVRTIEIVKSLRNFSRLDEEEMKLANFNESLDSTLVILQNKTKGRIELIKEYDEKLPKVNCYPGQMNQVFMNILSNAIQAIGKENEGSIWITTQDFENKVVVKIKDSGQGMSEDVKKRLFEPFFTTKEVGEGTGLGMSITYGIIEKHNGKVIVNSQVGAGAEFVITIPKVYPEEME